MSNDNRGYVYVLSNPSMPGILKIGRSKHGGQGRADTLYKNDTGVALPFELEFEILTADCVDVERRVHDAFLRQRLNPGREFFRIDLRTAVAVVADYAVTPLNIRIFNPDNERLSNASCENYLQADASISRCRLKNDKQYDERLLDDAVSIYLNGREAQIDSIYAYLELEYELCRARQNISDFNERQDACEADERVVRKAKIDAFAKSDELDSVIQFRNAEAKVRKIIKNALRVAADD